MTHSWQAGCMLLSASVEACILLWFQSGKQSRTSRNKVPGRTVANSRCRTSRRTVVRVEMNQVEHKAETKIEEPETGAVPCARFAQHWSGCRDSNSSARAIRSPMTFLQLWQTREASVSEVPGTSAPQGSKCVLLTRLLQGAATSALDVSRLRLRLFRTFPPKNKPDTRKCKSTIMLQMECCYLQSAWVEHKKCHKLTNAWMYVTNRGQVSYQLCTMHIIICEQLTTHAIMCT